MSKCIYTQEQFDKIIEERNELANENFKLKQHLAEKEDRISRLQFEVQQALSNSLGKTIKELIDMDKQAKISFAVEQLEKVKELVEEKSMTQSPFGTQKIYASDVSAIVDSRIEELKKENVNDKEKS